MSLRFILIIPPSTLKFPYGLSLKFLHQKTICTNSLPEYATCPTHLLYLTTLIIFVQQCKSCFSLRSPQSSVSSSLLGINVSSATYYRTWSARIKGWWLHCLMLCPMNTVRDWIRDIFDGYTYAKLRTVDISLNLGL